MKNRKIAIEVEIKNIKKIKLLENQLKSLRKEQKSLAKTNKDAVNLSKEDAKIYSRRAKAIKKASTALRGHRKAIDGTNAAMKKSGGLQESMSKGFLNAATTIGVVVMAFRTAQRVISSILSTYTDFEFQMAKVQAVSGATDEEFKRLTSSAEKLGRTTFFTAQQVAELQTNFAKLGFTATEIEAAQEATLQLATATGSDLARSATVAGAAIRGFGLDASETQRVVDVMAVAFTSSAMDIEKWQTSMTKVAPIAKAAGFSIEDTAAIMSKLTDSGIEASIAGTSLRNILLKMQDPTSQLSKVFGKTIHSLDDLVPAMKKFVAEGGSMADVMEVVDLRQAAAFEQMLTTADGTLELRDSLLAANGAGRDMADILENTLEGAWLKFQSAIQGLSISIVKDFAGGLQKSAESAAKFMNTLARNSKVIVKTIKVVSKLVKWIGLYKLGVMAAMGVSRGYIAVTKGIAAAKALMATATRAATLSLKGFKLALVSTGVGALVVLLGEALTMFMGMNDEVDRSINFSEILREEAEKYKTSLKKVEGASKRLISAKKKLNELADKEGNLYDDNEKNAKLYRIAKAKEIVALKDINTERKNSNLKLISEKSNIDDVIKSTKELTVAMKNNMLVRMYEEMNTAVLKVAVNAELIKEDFSAVFKEGAFGDFNKLGDAMDDIKKGLDDPSWWETGSKSATFLSGLLESYDMSLSDFEKAIKDGYFEKQSDKIKKSINSKLTGGVTIDEMLADKASSEPSGVEGIDPIKDFKDIENKLLIELHKSRSKTNMTEVEYARRLIEIKKEVLEKEREYIEKNNADNEITRSKLFELDKKILGESAKLREFDFKEREKIRSQQLAADKTSTEEANQNALISLYQKNLSLLKLDEAYLEEKLAIYKLAGKDFAEIENAINKNTLSQAELTFNEEGRLLDIALQNKNNKLQENYSNNVISLFDKNMTELELEEQHLMDKRDRYEAFGLDIEDIDNRLFENRQKQHEEEKRFALEKIEGYLALGQSIMELAGNEEGLNKIKQIGIKIQQAATLAKNIAVLQDKMDEIQSYRTATAKGVEAGASLGAAGADAVGAVSKAANNVFPYNLIAIAATIASLVAVVASARSLFGGGGGGKGGGGGGSTVPTHTQYADGGMVQGNSHAQGGEKFAVGGRVVELEGGEAVINKRSTSMFKGQLSAMNAAGGGVKFADGGMLSNPSFSEQQFSAINNRKMRNAVSRGSKVVVVESDITDTQESVSVIQSEATF